jgi:predicted protein tyrosine phosphatase
LAAGTVVTRWLARKKFGRKPRAAGGQQQPFDAKYNRVAPTGVTKAPKVIKNVLFICSRNQLRSPTAEHVFSTWPDVETDSAGLLADADIPLSTEQIKWADIIFVMEKTHRTKLSRRFRKYLNGKRVICLDIPDDYDYMDLALVKLLEAKAGRFLR